MTKGNNKMTKFDVLNQETKNYHNGISRNIGWYIATGIYDNSKKKSTEKTGRYLGNGKYVID